MTQHLTRGLCFSPFQWHQRGSWPLCFAMNKAVTTCLLCLVWLFMFPLVLWRKIYRSPTRSWAGTLWTVLRTKSTLDFVLVEHLWVKTHVGKGLQVAGTQTQQCASVLWVECGDGSCLRDKLQKWLMQAIHAQELLTVCMFFCLQSADLFKFVGVCS